MKRKLTIKLSSFQIITLGFIGIILLGAILLMFPISSKSGVWTPFINALFTSTSAVCVTGLIVYDTAVYWSVFGQVVILLLIQIGGMGVVTMVAAFVMISGKKLGLLARGTIRDAVASHSIGGIIRYIGFILKAIFLIELIGALIMLPVFVIDYGAEGIWMAIFHSVSAFCNAGFDIMGTKTGEFSSLTGYVSDPVINLTICALIIIGGIGFMVWRDVADHKFRLSKYSLQSKVALLVTAILLVVPAIYFFFFEFQHMEFGERLLASIFQTVTPRTAGFNTVNLNAISQVGLLTMIILMLVGGSSGSTAGGMKTSTLAILFATVISLFKKKDETELLRRRVDNEAVKSSVAILIMYVSLFLLGSVIICKIEGLELLPCFYETASAIGTVGLSLGITPQLHVVSKLILILLMFFGRVGGLTLFFALFNIKKKPLSKYSAENISIG